MNEDRLFDWDEEKNKVNIAKHGISFEIATKVFQDPYLIDWYDEEHSGYNKSNIWEDRYIALGYVEEVLFVVYTVREQNSNEITRMISARLASAKESQVYFESRGDE